MSQHTHFNEDTINESASVACSNCESWTLSKNEETRLDAFEMKGVGNILQVLWIAKETNEWVLNKAGVKKELVDSQSKEASIPWSHHEETRELPGERQYKKQCQVHEGEEDHQDADRTLRGRVIQNDRGKR